MPRDLSPSNTGIRRSDRQAARQTTTNASPPLDATTRTTRAPRNKTRAQTALPPPPATQGMDQIMHAADQPAAQLLPLGAAPPPTGAPPPPEHMAVDATAAAALVAQPSADGAPLPTQVPYTTSQLNNLITHILRSGSLSDTINAIQRGVHLPQSTNNGIAPTLQVTQTRQAAPPAETAPLVTQLGPSNGQTTTTLPPRIVPSDVPGVLPVYPPASPELAVLTVIRSLLEQHGVTMAQLRSLFEQSALTATQTVGENANPSATHALPHQPSDVILVDDPPVQTRPTRTYAVVQNFQRSLRDIAFDGKSLTSLEDLNAWIEKLCMMCNDFGYTEGHEFSSSLHHAFTSKALTWLTEVLPMRPHWTQPQFKKEFMARFAGQVRDPRAEALTTLVQRRIFMQPNETVQAYSERFLSVSRKVPDVTGVALCQLYIAGLNDTLRPKCVLTNSNTEWESLHALMRHSFAESLRISLSTTPSAAIQAPPQSTLPVTPNIPSVTPYLPNPNQRWGKHTRAAVLSHLQSSFPMQNGAGAVDSDTQMTEADDFIAVASPKRTKRSAATAAAGPSAIFTSSLAPVSPPPPPRAAAAQAPTYATVAAITATVPSGPDPSVLPRFCNFHKISMADVQVGTMRSPDQPAHEPGLPIFYHPPPFTQDQLNRLPGYGTEGRNRGVEGKANFVRGIKLAEIPGAKKALEDAGVCTICRTGLHPPVFCPNAKKGPTSNC